MIKVYKDRKLYKTFENLSMASKEDLATVSKSVLGYIPKDDGHALISSRKMEAFRLRGFTLQSY